MNDPDFKSLSDAWVHLTPWQKKIIVWRVWIESIRSRAFRFVQKLTGGNRRVKSPNDEDTLT